MSVGITFLKIKIYQIYRKQYLFSFQKRLLKELVDLILLFLNEKYYCLGLKEVY